MYPRSQDTLSAFTMRREDRGVRSPTPVPFLGRRRGDGHRPAARHRHRPDPVTAEREQWDDGNNTLALAPGVVVAYERNVETNARLDEAGIEVLRIAASELGSGRGGPAACRCPAARDPLRFRRNGR